MIRVGVARVLGRLARRVRRPRRVRVGARRRQGVHARRRVGRGRGGARTARAARSAAPPAARRAKRAPRSAASPARTRCPARSAPRRAIPARRDRRPLRRSLRLPGGHVLSEHRRRGQPPRHGVRPFVHVGRNPPLHPRRRVRERRVRRDRRAAFAAFPKSLVLRMQVAPARYALRACRPPTRAPRPSRATPPSCGRRRASSGRTPRGRTRSSSTAR